MSQPVIPYAEVNNPPLTPLPYGLMSVATVQLDDTGRWRQAGATYQTDGCLDTRIWDVRCPGNPAELVAVVATGARQITITVTGNQPVAVWTDAGATRVLASPGTPLVYTYPGAGAAATLKLGGRYVAEPGTGTALAFPLTVSATPIVTTSIAADGLADTTKQGDGLHWLTGHPFSVYQAVDCQAIGNDAPEDVAARRLQLHEGRAVEQLVWQRQLAVPSASLATATASASLLGALGALEGALGTDYGAVGAIHAPRWLAPYFANRYQLQGDGRVQRTVLGTPVAFGAGYLGTGPNGEVPAAGTAYVYATGQVTVRRSAVLIPATRAQGFNPSTNQVLTVAERDYLVTTDCALFYALVDITGDEPPGGG